MEKLGLSVALKIHKYYAKNTTWNLVQGSRLICRVCGVHFIALDEMTSLKKCQNATDGLTEILWLF